MKSTTPRYGFPFDENFFVSVIARFHVFGMKTASDKNDLLKCDYVSIIINVR